VLLVREAVRLEDLPFDLHVVTDGQAAIDFIAKAEADAGAPRPDYLLLDLNLPRKDGFQVLERVRTSPLYKDVSVLVMTSSDAPADRTRAHELGAGYFRKPPNYDAFLAIGQVLRQLFEGRENRGQ
jgi:DNA-binding response OmpR family regulator